MYRTQCSYISFRLCVYKRNFIPTECLTTPLSLIFSMNLPLINMPIKTIFRLPPPKQSISKWQGKLQRNSLSFFFSLLPPSFRDLSLEQNTIWMKTYYSPTHQLYKHVSIFQEIHLHTLSLLKLYRSRESCNCHYIMQTTRIVLYDIDGWVQYTYRYIHTYSRHDIHTRML